jgi:hypothetical protein
MRTVSCLAVSAVCLAAVVSPLGGCATPAEQKAQDGLTAFKNCDLRSASSDFDQAHALDPSRPDFALAYALSTIAVLPEDPAITAFLQRIGFTGALDTSALWGSGGVLDQLASGNATCQSVSDYLRAHIPYAPAQTNGPSAVSVIRDPSVSADDALAAAAALSPRLEKLVSALEQSASGGDVDIEGGCGVGKVHIQEPELYGLAAALELLRATIQAGQGYDWALSLTLLFDTSGHEQAYVDALNAHLLHLKNSGAVGAAQPIAIHAVQLFQKGLNAAAGVTSRPANSLFDWTKMPAGTLVDLQTLAGSALQMLSIPGPQPVAYYTPALRLDGQSFFTNPVDMAGVQPPMFSAVPWSDASGQSGYSVDSSATGADNLIAPRFSPSPFGQNAPSYSFGLSDRWSNFTSDDWLAAFDPDRKWDNVYRCSN